MIGSARRRASRREEKRIAISAIDSLLLTTVLLQALIVTASRYLVGLEPTLDAKLGRMPAARTASEASGMLSLAQTDASGTQELIQVQRFNKAH